MEVKTLGIRLFLKHFTDERLHELYAHTEDMKLSYLSCCCLVGSLTADHKLQLRSESFPIDHYHYKRAFEFSYSSKAEKEFYALGNTDKERCEKLLPILNDEISFRAKAKLSTAEMVEVSA